MTTSWRAYYAGGVTFDSSETRVEELPDGLLGVVEFLEHPYRKIVDGGDWYWMEDGRWQATGSIWEGWVERPEGVPDERLKRGLGISDDGWSEARARMLDDLNWPD